MSNVAQRQRIGVSIDTRSLACFRLLLAVFILLEWCGLGGFSTPLPVGRFDWSFVDWVSTGVSLILLASVLTFALGYNTRWSTVVLWAAYSLFHAGVATSKLYALVGPLLVLSLLLPLSRHASFDDAMDRGNEADGVQANNAFEVTTVAALVLKGFAFLVLCLLALLSIFDTDRFVTVPVVAAVALIAVMLLPAAWALTRFWTVVGLCAGFLVSSLVLTFSTGSARPFWLGAVAVSLFIPAQGWAALGNRASMQARHGLRIYYDKPCGFCRKICFIFASFMLLGRCSIATAQSDDRAHALLLENDSWVVFDRDGNVALCWAAVLVLLRASPVWRPLGCVLTLVGMGTWGQPIYRLIGRMRGALSAVTARVLPYKRYSPELGGVATWGAVVWLFLLCLGYFGALDKLAASLS